MGTYAVLGSTGNCGTALIKNLLRRPDAKIRAYCRNRQKLLHLLPEIESSTQSTVFEGSIEDTELLTKCISNCQAIFLVISTADNIPGLRAAQNTAASVIHGLECLRTTNKAFKSPRLVLLSSAILDDHLSRHTPWILRKVLHLSASNVYADLEVAESMLRGQQDWLTTIFMKPGALSIDVQRGHALSLTDEGSPLSYLDLAAAMIEAADDTGTRYDMQNVGVLNTNGAACFPRGTPMTIVVGLISHFLPFLFPYLPHTGPG
ncbi:hypothetical protein JX265_003586 [Neoarthrinium moseri]|uniref:NAD(P)-binding domain-containing protein n=1 Tax=Neoarthrinium moseri TaxID=1658444 RepID=A0A9P9WSJ3_9PEZI|nr:hypothetical protein JX265_003586 [Neoarthrinium moseri]